jgi:hypothetical protein
MPALAPRSGLSPVNSAFAAERRHPHDAAVGTRPDRGFFV